MPSDASSYTGTYFGLGRTYLGALKGYLSSIRLTKSAVYTSNFAPSYIPLTKLTDTVLLTCNSSAFSDEGSSLTITSYGNAKLAKINDSGMVVEQLNTVRFSSFNPNAQSYGNWSVNIEAGNLVTLPASSIWSLGNTYTIEFWIYPIALTSGIVRLITIGTNNTSSAYVVAIGGSAGMISAGVPMATVPNNTLDTASGLVSAKKWQHVAISVNAGFCRIFLNGEEKASGNLAVQTAASMGVRIGFDTTATVDARYNGYISNLRIVKGYSLYNQNFQPPTSKLENVPGTQLLTFLSNEFKDYSSNNFKLTNSSAKIKPSSPFVEPNFSSSMKGSCYLSGGQLRLDNSCGAFGLNDFTVEFWIYRNSANAVQTFDARPDSTNGRYVTLGVHADGTVSASANAAVFVQSASNIVQPYEWKHIAVVRKNLVLKIYVNGKLEATTNDTNDYLGTAKVRICGNAYTGNYGDAYFYNYRVQKEALYDGDFSVNPDDLTVSQKTVSLLEFDNLKCVDSSMQSVVIPVGNVVSSNSDRKNGSRAYYLDGSGDYFLIPYRGDFNFSLNNWTIETWFKADDLNVTRALIGKDTYGQNHDLSIYVGKTWLSCYTNGAASILVATVTVQPNEWNHIVLTRDNGTLKFYLNGIMVGSNTMGITNASGSYLTIGCVSWNNPNTFFKGYIDDFRIMYGVKYSGNFTPE